MDELRTILVGVDFSPCSTAALKQAVHLARDSEAKLCVFHVLDHLVILDLAEALSRKTSELEAEVVDAATLSPVFAQSMGREDRR